ncbi:unnamed protein product [Tetraodon nigroviridis]|uniref:(spotted green pufferfish) hypothetical protein n=1 Tax=Tetraodon nigroviridis TaxID=99883 RepID=Q4SKB2_TETNG|nr:unnamed protein product [Tetraodon nigroviridis]
MNLSSWKAIDLVNAYSYSLEQQILQRGSSLVCRDEDLCTQVDQLLRDGDARETHCLGLDPLLEMEESLKASAADSGRAEARGGLQGLAKAFEVVEQAAINLYLGPWRKEYQFVKVTGQTTVTVPWQTSQSLHHLLRFSSLLGCRCTPAPSPISSNRCCRSPRSRGSSACWATSSALGTSSSACSRPGWAGPPRTTSSAWRAPSSWLAASAACCWRPWGSAPERASGSSAWSGRGRKGTVCRSPSTTPRGSWTSASRCLKGRRKWTCTRMSRSTGPRGRRSEDGAHAKPKRRAGGGSEGAQQRRGLALLLLLLLRRRSRGRPRLDAPLSADQNATTGAGRP